MIRFNSENKEMLINLLSNYVGIQSNDINVEGIFLFAYLDDKNCFEVITFMKNQPGKILSATVYTSDNYITYRSLAKEIIDFQAIELSSGTILYDPNSTLLLAKIKYLESHKLVVASNQLELDEEFTNSLFTEINKKVHDLKESNDKDETILAMLTNYYYHLLGANDEINEIMVNMIINNIDCGNFGYIGLVPENRELHFKALNEAIYKKGENYKQIREVISFQKKYTNK